MPRASAAFGWRVTFLAPRYRPRFAMETACAGATLPAVFPETRYSAVAAAASDDPDERRAAVARLVQGYYKPVYAHLRARWRLDPERAADLVQGVFEHVRARDVFAAYQQDRGRFRTFVRTCLDHVVESDFRAQQRKKRGGGQRFVSAELLAEYEVDLGAAEPAEDPFDKEFVRALFERGVERLRERLAAANKSQYFELFRSYDLVDQDDRPTYATLAERFGLRSTDVTNYLHFARKELRRALVEELRALTRDEAELEEEARALGLDIEAIG